MIVYPNVHVDLAPGRRLHGGGELHLGRYYDGGRAFPSELKVRAGGTLCVDGRFWIFTGCRVSVNDDARLRLGSGYINPQATIDCFEEIDVGERVAIAKEVLLRDSDDHVTAADRPRRAPIRIEDGVWIGTRATVLKGVTIGAGAVVAAGALVREDVPPRALVGGVPARVLRENVDWRK